MKSSNPIFKIEQTQTIETTNAATYTGISIKTLILIGVTVLSGVFSSMLLKSGNEGLYGVLAAASITALISVFVASFSLRLVAPFTILYAFAEGIVLGVLTTIANMLVPGAGTIAIIAVGLIFVTMYALYSTNVIKVTKTFSKIMIGGLFAILIFSLIGGIFLRDIINQNPALFIGISVFFIIYGALMLALDFNHAQMVVENGLDKRYEWRISLGLMVSLIWIYVEVLRLIIYIASIANKD